MKARLNMITQSSKADIEDKLGGQVQLFVFTAIASTLVSTGILSPSVKIEYPIGSIGNLNQSSVATNKNQLVEIPLNPALNMADAATARPECGRTCGSPPSGVSPLQRFLDFLRRLFGLP